ncbi:hypothetical protein N0V90_009436 [Kalmusia sp. IMI 367209]|nr:hypothetical protein N0V90_009436 [Kalmusia sp. IMI 367209]
MAAARSRRQNGSLGDSWGTADYSDENVSIDSADSLSDADSQSDYFEERERDVPEEQDEDDMATPMPLPKKPQTSQVLRDFPSTRASYVHQDTPTKARVGSRSQMPRDSSRSSQQPTSQQSLEPSLIMPSMHTSINGFNHASPMRNSQLKNRKLRQASTQSRSSRMSGSSQVTPRRASRTDPGPQQHEAAGPWHYIELFRAHVLWPILKYLLDVFANAMNSFMKPIFGFLLGFVILIGLIHYSSIFLRNTFEVILAPVCMLPFSSYFVPFCDTSPSSRQPDFEQLVTVQSAFEDVLEANKDSYALPANMKKSQVAIRDLRSQVKFSRLPSRAELEVEFDYFIETAREASDHLAKYNAKIGYVMDQTISTNKWTLQVLHGIASQAENTGRLPRAIAYLNPLSVLYAPSDTLEQRIFEQYVLHVGKVKHDITGLIDMSESLIALLNALENRLDVIADIALRDDIHVSRDRELLLAQLWSRLGGNRSSKASSDASLQLLRQVMRYRSQAVQHVTATLLKLQEIAAGLENLRDGVAAPEVVGFRSDVPLQWHIEVVGRCIERLRDTRGETLAIEREAIKKGLGESGAENGRNLLGGEMPTVYAKSSTEA